MVVGSCQRLSFTTPTVEDAVFARRKQRILVSLSSITTYRNYCIRASGLPGRKDLLKVAKCDLESIDRVLIDIVNFIP